VDDHRPVLLVVVAHVGEIEALGRSVVELEGAGLPGAAQRVGDRVVDLRAVEGAVARVELPGKAHAVERGPEHGLGLVPQGVVADPVGRVHGAGGEAELEVEPERPVDRPHQLHEAAELVGDLRLHGEDVGVVLGELPDPGEAAQRSRELVPVQHVGGEVTDGQLAVRSLAHLVEEVVRRAVHGLEAHVEPLLDGQGRIRLLVQDEEHVLLVHAPVAALLPQLLVEEERRLHLLVAEPLHQPAHGVGQHVVEDGPLGQPEGRARRHLVEGVEAERGAQLPVVALLHLLQLVEVSLQLLPVEEGGAVDPLQHRVAGVAAPVGAGDVEQLHHPDAAGGGAVRA